MFIVTELKTGRKTRTNDINDLADIVIGITGAPEDGWAAVRVAGNMKWGDKADDGEVYSIECVK